MLDDGIIYMLAAPSSLHESVLRIFDNRISRAINPDGINPRFESLGASYVDI